MTGTWVVHSVIILAALFAPQYAHAQTSTSKKSASFIVSDPRGVNNQRDIIYSPQPAIEFKQIEYLTLDPPQTLDERIDRLLHGISIDIPPEYDPHGHEIRRYMAMVGHPEIINSIPNLQGQIQNIENAEKILDHWFSKYQDEIKAIEHEIETDETGMARLQTFKYNKAIIENFFINAFQWLKTDKAMLEFLVVIGPDYYQFHDPKLSFREPDDQKKFKELYEAQREALSNMHQYTPFRMMVY